MKNNIFSSSLKDHFKTFIEFKRQSGYKYANITLLVKLDKYFTEHFPEAKTLTFNIFQGYAESLSGLEMSSRVICWSALRQFSIYLHQIIPKSEALQYNPFKMSRAKRVYLYSQEEIQVLMKAAMQLGPQNSIRPFSIHTLIGLLLITGMRIGEALSLKQADFSSAQQLLLIKNAKFGKDRWLPLTESTTVALNNYLKARKYHANSLSNNAFFLATSGKPISYSSVLGTFRKLITTCMIGNQQRKQHPRIHDFRHTYVINCLTQWDRDHLDVNALLPVLSTYLGHVNVASTQYYLRTTPELWTSAQRQFHRHFQQSVLGCGGGQ